MFIQGEPLVLHTCSSNVVNNNAASSISRVRQATPKRTNEAALDKQRWTSSASQHEFTMMIVLLLLCVLVAVCLRVLLLLLLLSLLVLLLVVVGVTL